MKNNRGSAVIEMTLLIPVLIGLVMLFVFLFLNTIYDATVQGDGYTCLYSYSEDGVLQDQAVALQGELTRKITHGQIGVLGIEKATTLHIDVVTKPQKNAGYSYESNGKKLQRDRNLCADRLRRWQVYGDVIWE